MQVKQQKSNSVLIPRFNNFDNMAVQSTELLHC